MARIVVIGDLMTDTVAHATLPLARGSDTPAKVTTHGGGSGANVAAWLGADGADVAFIGRRGADIAGRNRDMELMGYSVDARLVMDPERPTGTCVVMVTHKGERTMLSDPGANSALSPDDLPHDLFVPGRAPARLRVHAAVRGVARGRARRARLRRPGRHVDLGGRGVGGAARAGRGRAVLRADRQRAAAVRERRPGPGAHRPGGRRRRPPGCSPPGTRRSSSSSARTARCSSPTAAPRCGCPRPRLSGSSTGPGAGDAFIAGFLPPWQDKKPPMEALASGCRLAAHALNLIGARPIL